MKTKSILQLRDPSLLVLLLFCFSINSALPGQELEQLISSKFEVIDEQDHQFIDCNTYRFGNDILYDNPNVIRLYENGAYRFDFKFSYFDKNGIINPSNYLDKFYSVQVPESIRKSYRVTAVSPKGDNLSIYAIATGDPGIQDTFRIQLLDKEAKLLADAIYPFQVREDIPDATETAFLPMKIEFKPIFVRLEDVNNPNNRIERQLMPFSPDTINLDAKEAFNFITEIEEEVQVNGQSYVLVANHEKNYGYQVNLSWEGKSLQDKPNSKNGLRSYLTTVPGRNRPSRPVTVDLTAIMAADLKKAGLDQGGKRVQQEYVFVEPNTKLTKVYQMDYIKQHPNISSSRKDQKSTQYLINKHLPLIQNNFKEANQQVFHYYQLSPQQKINLQKAQISTNSQPAPAKTGKTQTTIPAKPSQQKYAVIQNTQKPAATATKEARVRDHRKTTVNPALSRTQRVNPNVARRNETVRVATPRPPSPQPKGDYYTLAIEVSRKTEVMSHRTYLLTFRIIN